jgi:hypothetical protein
MAYTETQRVAVRRYCGYPMFGGQAVQAFGYRFFTHYGTLEFRMTNGGAEEEAVVVAKLSRLAALEEALASTSDNLDTHSAGPWVHNAKEFRQRLELYAYHRQELAAFFGVPPGPQFGQSGGGLRLAV